MIDTIIFSIIVMSITGLVLGLVIGIIARVFRVKTDSRIELVTELLPGANCGGCGKAGCADFAKAVVAGELSPDKCPVSTPDVTSSIAKVLGIEVGKGFKMTAYVACGGDMGQVTRAVNYNGISDCNAAAIVGGGPKECQYGCLGLGSCARKCPFGAIEIVNNLAVVHSNLCVGCGTCVAVCPRNVIKLIPAGSIANVYCNSEAKGVTKKKSCNVPCIGCRKCAKAVPEKFTVEGFLAKVNYQAEPLTKEEIDSVGCPTGCLRLAEDHLRIETNNPEGNK